MKKKNLLYKEARLSVRQIIRVVELEKKVEHGGLPFIEKDIRNLFTKVKRMIAPDDAMDLIESMKLAKEENFKGMTTTDRLESINAFIKRFICSRISLVDFFKQILICFFEFFSINIKLTKIDVAIKEIEFKRTHNNMIATVRPTSLKMRSPLEEQAFQVLAPFAFKKFQEEIQKASQYSLVHEDGKQFISKHYKSNGRMHMVFCDGSITLWNYANFEFWGMLCRHILRDCFHIPPGYLSLHWHSDMAESSVFNAFEKRQKVSANDIGLNAIFCLKD
ncbi:hypothetical protein Cgig2_023375 [Carnegiea gigantea]|uniref:Protein FAR1-RELATED SEQUENCE n=1 Tax=Carnegiea gigantea TaxID=171969 RepID=A0A9Q1GP70_9CARY|nr:hypothetical protein Cgig2_023375 [Carnegiea gigantea]